MIKLFEMFAGYGGASFALKKAGIPFETVGFSEIDKYAIQCYNQNHYGIDYKDDYNEVEVKVPIHNFGDCTKINPEELPDFDLLTGGFPCQSFSVAGKGLGELDTRGTLFNEIIRIAEVKQPKYMLLENVKGLTTKKHKDTFAKILSELDRIGYVVDWKVLNSKDYGIPQNRERVFFVCHRKDLPQCQWYDMNTPGVVPHYESGFEFPEKEELKLFLKDIIKDDVDETFNLSEKQKSHLINHINKRFKLDDDGVVNCIGTCFGRVGSSSEELEMFRRTNNAIIKRIQFDISGKGYNSQQDRAYFTNGIMCCLPNANPMNTVNIIELVNSGFKFRRLTPTECFRLMGFIGDEINLDGLSNTQKYKLAGNGWDINLVSKIYECIFYDTEKDKLYSRTIKPKVNKY